MRKRQNPEIATREIWKKKFPSAKVVYLAGSIIRGEATPYSDLDLVVVFDKLENAWRETFIWKGWPVDAFIHVPGTLAYFFEELDAKSGQPSLPQMLGYGENNHPRP